MSAAVRVGTSERATQKAEDFSYVSLDSPATDDESPLPPMTFAIFDGHGGKRAAVACLRDVAGRLLMGGPTKWSDDDIADAFWDADHALGAHGIMDGTTATVLLVEDCGDGSLRCTLAWVGDSAAVHVDMLGVDADASIKHATELHAPDNEDELKRLRTEWAVRQHVHKNWDWVMRELLSSSLPSSQKQRGANSAGDSNNEAAAAAGGGASGAHGGDAAASGVSLRKSVLAASKAYRQTRAALEEVQGKEPPSEEVHLYMRILHREHLMNVAGQSGPTEETLAPMTSIGPRRPPREASGRLQAAAAAGGASSRAAEEARRRSTVRMRFGDYGPMSLKSSKVVRLERSPTTVLEGASTLVTRSIGDWDASRACIPHPQIMRFELARGTYARLILASDGLWDFATHEKAAALVRRARSAQTAADRLTRFAWDTSHARLNRLKDDTTVVVVELDCRDVEARTKAAATPTSRACAVQ